MANFLDVKRPQDWINLALAVLLFVSPWVVGYSADTRAAWSACLAGMAIAALALAALAVFAEWEEWLALLLGVWVVAAPWVLGFSANVYAHWTHVVLGALVAVTAAWELWQVRARSSAT
jgi:heme/copper-type cytochrome/quinol oxidase subunit 3